MKREFKVPVVSFDDSVAMYENGNTHPPHIVPKHSSYYCVRILSPRKVEYLQKDGTFAQDCHNGWFKTQKAIVKLLKTAK